MCVFLTFKDILIAAFHCLAAWFVFWRADQWDQYAPLAISIQPIHIVLGSVFVAITAYSSQRLCFFPVHGVFFDYFVDIVLLRPASASSSNIRRIPQSDGSLIILRRGGSYLNKLHVIIRIFQHPEIWPLGLFWNARLNAAPSPVIHVRHIRFSDSRSPDCIRQIGDDIRFRLMGPDKPPVFFCVYPSRYQHLQHARSEFCLIIAVFTREAVFFPLWSRFIPRGEGRVFWGKVHQLSASLRAF